MISSFPVSSEQSQSVSTRQIKKQTVRIFKGNLVINFFMVFILVLFNIFQSILASEQSSSKNPTDSETDGLSSLNLSLQSLKSSISQTSSTAVRLLQLFYLLTTNAYHKITYLTFLFRIKYNKKARLEGKKIKALSKNVPVAARKHYKKTHSTTQYTSGPDVITPLKLWSIVYLALRIHKTAIHVSDMLR